MGIYMKTIKVKTIDDHELYVKARTHLHREDFVKFKKLKKSHHLNQEERKILQAREYIHAQKWNKSLEILKTMGLISSEYLNAEMYAIKAYLYQVMAKPQESLWANQRALFYYELCEDQEGLFRNHYNRAVILEQFRLFELMGHHYEEARKNAAEDHQIVHLLKAEAFNEWRLNRSREALLKIEEAFQYGENIEKTHLDNLKTVAAEIYVKTDQLDKAYLLLKELSVSKINPEKGRSLCELRFLEALRGELKMKPAPESVKAMKEWHLKWQIISYLIGGERESAERKWKELSQFYPQRFEQNFTIADDFEKKTLFGLLLDKVFKASKKDEKEIPTHLSKPEILLWLLENSPNAQRKEDLIEAIWQIPYEPKLDARFYKLVQRLKKEHPIINQGGAYSLQEPNKAA